MPYCARLTRSLFVFTEHMTSRSSMENAIRIHIYIYLITSILKNIASQLLCISANAAGTSAIPVTDEQYLSVAM